MLLLIFIAIGFAVGRAKIFDSDHTKSLSGMLVYTVFACSVFKTFSERFTPEYLVGNYRLILISVTILCVLAVVTHFVAKLFTKHKYDRCVYEYSLASPNYGYMGYALAGALLGQAGLMDFMVYCIPISVYVYTIGFSKLTCLPARNAAIAISPCNRFGVMISTASTSGSASNSR